MRQVRSVFLVEDDPDDQHAFTEAVTGISDDIILSVASNGKEALELLSSSIIKPDIIFSDINMPVMDGFIFLKTVKETEELREIPVVILTTSANSIHHTIALKLGAEQLFVKPSSFLALGEIISETIALYAK